MIELSIEIQAPIETAWTCVTEAAQRRRWWSPAGGPRVPGRCFSSPASDDRTAPADAAGEVLSATAPRELRLSWMEHDWPIATEVFIRLERTPSGTRLALTHGGWSAFPEDDRSDLIRSHRERWLSRLTSLADRAEGAAN